MTFKVCASWVSLDLGNNQGERAVVTNGWFGQSMCLHCVYIYLCTHSMISPGCSKKLNFWVVQRIREHFKMFDTYF